MKILIAQNLDIWDPILNQTKQIISIAAEKTEEYFAKEDELEGKELSVLLTDDEFIQNLNREYRGKDKATNVLTFPHMDYKDSILQDAGMGNVFGEIILSYNTLKREAVEQNKTFDDHLAHLIVHSVLHLFGYDHINETEADIMEDIEVEILSELGIKNPYI